MQTPSEALLSLANWLESQGNKYDSNGSTAFAYFRGASEARMRAKQCDSPVLRLPLEAAPAKEDDLCVCGYLYSQHTGAKPMCPITCDSGGRCDFIFTPIPAIAPAQTLAYFNEREAFLAGQRSKETK